MTVAGRNGETRAMVHLASSLTAAVLAGLLCLACFSRPGLARGPESVADVAEGLQDTVVNISTTQTLKGTGEKSPPSGPGPKGSPFEDLFDDCERGAIPAVGECYGLDTLVDDSIEEQPEIYFEGGDHATLVRMSSRQFADLTAAARHARFSRQHWCQI